MDFLCVSFLWEKFYSVSDKLHDLLDFARLRSVSRCSMEKLKWCSCAKPDGGASGCVTGIGVSGLCLKAERDYCFSLCLCT